MSTKLMPASSALWMIRMESSWSGLPMAPTSSRPDRTVLDPHAGSAQCAALHEFLVASAGACCWRAGWPAPTAFNLQHHTECCSGLARASLAARDDLLEALAKWLQRFAGFIATNADSSAALHLGDPAYGTGPLTSSSASCRRRALLDTAAKAWRDPL